MSMLFFSFSYKYWTCCNKRTSDFQEFLKQGGCDSGKHEWMKPSEVSISDFELIVGDCFIEKMVAVVYIY